jgi:hypothetical protein
MRYTNPTLNGVNISNSLHTKLPPATNICTKVQQSNTECCEQIEQFTYKVINATNI